MKKIISSLLLAAGTCMAAPVELVNLDLSSEEPGSLLTAHPNQNTPLSLPTKVNGEEGNSLRVEREKETGKVILLEKNTGTESVGFAFEWTEAILPSPMQLEARFGLFLPSGGQRGNIAIALRSRRNKSMVYVQIGGNGLVSVSGLQEEDIVRLGSLPMDKEINNLTLRLDDSSNELTVLLNDTPLGAIVKVPSELTPTSLTISSKSERASRTIIFHKISLVAHSP